MPIIPYLHFKGTCAEAMTFYADVFGADDLHMSTFSEAPPDMGMPNDPSRVLNSSFTVGGHRLMASDYQDDAQGDAQKGVSISYDVDTVQGAQTLFDRLLEGGDIVMPFMPTFWSKGFGMLRDRFGTHWMISVTGPDLSRS